MKKLFFVGLVLVGAVLVASQVYADVEVKFWADGDSYVTERDEWANKNYGGDAALRVRDTDMTGYENYTSRTYLNFDNDEMVSSFSGVDMGLVTFSLHLYEYARVDRDVSPLNDEDGINLYDAANSWSEMGITWNNQPGGNTKVASRMFDGADVISGPDPTLFWRSWQGDALDDLVKSWVDGTESNYGFMLENDLDGTYNEMEVAFRSRQYQIGDGSEGIYRPYLKAVITPEPVSMVLFGVGAGCMGLFGARKRKKSKIV